MIWVRSHKTEVLIFVLALAARLALFSFNFHQNHNALIPTIKGDDGYYELSQNILAGHGFSYDAAPPYRPNPLRPPVWPYLIAFFEKVFGSYWAVAGFEILLGSFIPVLGFHVAKRLVGEKLAKGVAWMMVFEPYLVLLSFVFYTETSFTFFFLAATLFIFRYFDNQTMRNAVWSGLFLGVATLIKPTIEFVPFLIPLALAIAWRKVLSNTHAKHLVVFLGVFILLMAPWVYRNHYEFGVWGVSAQPAFNLYVYLAPTVLAIDHGTNFDTEYQSFVKKGGFDENDINLSNSAFYKSEAMKVIGNHKMALVKSCLITIVTFFTHDGMLTFLGYSQIAIPNIVSGPAIYLVAHPLHAASLVTHYAASPAILIVFMRLVWILITIFFVVGSWLLLKKDRKLAAMCGFLMVIYFAVTTCINGFGVNARFRVPVDVFIFSFAVYGFLITWYGVKGRLQRKTIHA